MELTCRWWFAAFVAITPVLTAAPTTVTLQDYLGVAWEQELVHYDFDFLQGKLTGTAMARVEQVGGPLRASQITDVVRHEDGSIRSFRVWFLADVPARTSVTYRITPGKKGPDDPGPLVTVSSDAIELTTSAPQRMGIRLPAGTQEFLYPVPAASVPGPIQALLLPSGRWIGHGRFEVPFRVMSRRTDVIARGPVFAEARTTYVFDTGSWTLSARVIRNCPIVVIQEEFDTGYSRRPWNEADRFYSFALNTGGFQPTQAWYTGNTDRPEYHDLAKGIPQGILEETKSAGIRNPFCLAHGYTLSLEKSRDDYYLAPFPSWIARCGTGIRFVEPGKEAIGFVSVKGTFWRNPLSPRFRVARPGELVLSLPIQMYEQGWSSEGFARYSPNATGKTIGVPENTGRRHYGIMLSSAEDEKERKLMSLLTGAAKLGVQPLDEVKDWVLDWPDPLAKAEWAKEPSEAGRNALKIMRDWVRLQRTLGNFAVFAMWTHRSLTHVRYPAIKDVIDSPQALSAADRQELRRLCAFQAYVLNSLDAFPWGIGCHLGNPNMSIMAVNAHVKSSLLVKDHPMFRTWGEWSLGFARDYIDRFTRASGAPYENPHYTVGVTLLELAETNRMFLEEGIGDAFDSERFRKCVRFLFDWLTPPDPRFEGCRLLLPLGNASYQSVTPELAELFIEYYGKRDPELAGQVQWWANQTLPPDRRIHKVQDAVPPIQSVSYPEYGVSFRHGFGTSYETLFHFLAGNCHGHYELETDQMSYTLYAKGQPIHLHFGNGYFPMFIRPWLRNRVSIDHRREVSERHDARLISTGLTPEADYARAAKDIDRLDTGTAEYPPPYGSNQPDPWFPEPHEDIPLTTWCRQVLFLKDPDPRGPNYFVLRDTFAGTPTKPTDLSLWFLAKGMTRQDRTFHFEGQCEVNLDLFVASPATFEPETGQYEHRQQPYGRLVGFDPKYHPEGKLMERQLFVRFKQPPGQGYQVVLYPRLKENDPEAVFTALCEGAVRVETPRSTDYVFLNPVPVSFRDDRLEFDGMAAAVRFAKSGRVLVVNTEGSVRLRVVGKAVTGAGPFVATIEGGKGTVQTHAEKAWAEVK